MRIIIFSVIIAIFIIYLNRREYSCKVNEKWNHSYWIIIITPKGNFDFKFFSNFQFFNCFQINLNDYEGISLEGLCSRKNFCLIFLPKIAQTCSEIHMIFFIFFFVRERDRIMALKLCVKNLYTLKYLFIPEIYWLIFSMFTLGWFEIRNFKSQKWVSVSLNHLVENFFWLF